MPVSRVQILQGPCQVQFSGSTFYSKGAVTVALNMKESNIVSDTIGLVDYRDDDVMADVSFEPDGQVTNTLLALLFPFIQSGIYPGARVFGASDVPLIIWTRSGEKHTFNNAALTKQPTFMASAIKTAFGSCTFRCLRSIATAWSGANSLVSIAAVTYPGDAAYNLSNIITTPFLARWENSPPPTGTATATQASPAVFGDTADGLAIGDTVYNTGYTNPALNGLFTVATTPTSGTYTLYLYGTTTPLNNTVGSDTGTFTRQNSFDSFTTENGFTIETAVGLSDISTDDLGVIDMSFDQIEVTCKAIPVGPKSSEMLTQLAVQGSGAVRGRSRAAVGANLYLNGTGLYVKLTMASLVSTSVIGSSKKKRIGESTWKTTMTLTSGVPNPPLTLSTSTIS